MLIEKPDIPNFKLLRCIGRGSYGDVWLAKSISGTWCAIKVIWRNNFANDENFEQEFSGILFYEPISRAHDSLMDILYVGRDNKKNFYYYVNELADDSYNYNEEIITESYHPSTLTELIRRNPQGIKVSQLLEITEQLLSAINYLHSKNLIHRDIKPSNIIFINGKAKLADIGSVSLIGKKSLVGTQGYMPPEGPITKQSDLYSIGKVIYEAFTGLDRLDFPKLNKQQQLTRGTRRLNKVVCKLANPQLKERYQTAQAAKKDINNIINGKNNRRALKILQTSLLYLAFLLSAIIWAFSMGYFSSDEKISVEAIIEKQQSWVKLSSQPHGAQVINKKTNEILGITPLDSIIAVPQNESIEIEFNLTGYQSLNIKFDSQNEDLIILNPILLKNLVLEEVEEITIPQEEKVA